MRIIEISYERCYSLGNYENEKLRATVVLTSSDYDGRPADEVIAEAYAAARDAAWKNSTACRRAQEERALADLNYRSALVNLKGIQQGINEPEPWQIRRWLKTAATYEAKNITDVIVAHGFTAANEILSKAAEKDTEQWHPENDEDTEEWQPDDDYPF